MGNFKNKAFLLGLTCLALSFSSCGKTEGEAPSATPEPTQALPTLGGMSQKLEADGLTEKQHENALELKGKAFGELPAVGEEDAFYCNLPENVMGWGDLVPMCYDPLYGILYYVDDGGDWMIHAVRDGKSEVVLELSGKRLFCRNGKLYFLLDTRQTLKAVVDGAKDGNIISYDPIDGTVAVVSEEEFDSIVVYQDMIFCMRREETSETGAKVYYWFYRFDTGELIAEEKQEKISYVFQPKRYKQYFLTYLYGAYDRSKPDAAVEEWIEKNGVDPSEISVMVGMELRTWDSSETLALEGLPDKLPSAYYIKDDRIVWTELDGLHMQGIPSGKEEWIAAECGYGAGIFLDGTFYMADGFYMSYPDGKPGKNLLLTSTGSAFSDFNEICTDGKELYGVVNEWEKGGLPHLYRIKRSSREEFFEGLSDQMRSFYEQTYGDFDGVFRLYPVNGGEGAE